MPAEINANRKALVHRRVWRRSTDPFKNLTRQWLESGVKIFYKPEEDPPPAFDVNDEEEKAEAAQAVWEAQERKWAHEQSVKSLASKSSTQGYLTWFKGRELRAELHLPPPPKPEKKVVKEKAPPKEIISTLRISVVSAKDLRAADWSFGGGKSDPYCICKLISGSQVRSQFKTATIKKTLSPEWHHEATLEGCRPGDRLEFTVYDYDLVGADDLLGTASIEYEEFFPHGFEGELMLDDPEKHKEQATLTVMVEERPVEEQTAQDSMLRASSSTGSAGASARASGSTGGAGASVKRPKSDRELWFRAADPAALRRITDGGWNEVEVAWCWRGDFVAEGKIIAHAEGLKMATMDFALAHRTVQRTPALQEALRGHCVAVGCDGQREFWSPTFLQVLDMLRARWQVGDVVRISERELLRRKPDLYFPDLEIRQVQGPLSLHVPRSLRQLLQEEPPPPLHVPERLPCRLGYRHPPGAPWSRVLYIPPIGDRPPTPGEDRGAGAWSPAGGPGPSGGALDFGFVNRAGDGLPGGSPPQGGSPAGSASGGAVDFGFDNRAGDGLPGGSPPEASLLQAELSPEAAEPEERTRSKNSSQSGGRREGAKKLGGTDPGGANAFATPKKSLRTMKSVSFDVDFGLE